MTSRIDDFAAHERDDAIEAEGDAAVRRRAVLERVEEEAEPRPRVLVRDAEQAEHVPLHVGPVNPDAAAGDLGAVQRQVVGARARAAGRRSRAAARPRAAAT